MNLDANHVKIFGCDALSIVDLRVYALVEVFKAAYEYTDQCYFHFKELDKDNLEVRMRPKKTDVNPEILMRQYFNALIDHKLRGIVDQETRVTRDIIMAHALSKTSLIRKEYEDASPVIASDVATDPEFPDGTRGIFFQKLE